MTTATATQRDFLDRMGSAAEADGWAPIAGRLFGLLLLSPEPKCLDDIADELGVSKASVSIDARNLLERGILERVCRAGDRRDFYTLADDFCAAIIQHRLRRWRGFQRLASEARLQAPSQAPRVKRRVAQLDEFHQFMIERVSSAIADWDGQQRAAQVRSPAARPTGPRRPHAAKPRKRNPRA